MPGKKTSLTGATAAQAGYDYQVDVSLLAALRLLLITKAASRLILEPANEEDLEVDLAPNVHGRVEPSAVVAGGYKLVIQVKRRSGEPWSIEAFRARCSSMARRDDPHFIISRILKRAIFLSPAPTRKASLATFWSTTLKSPPTKMPFRRPSSRH